MRITNKMMTNNLLSNINNNKNLLNTLDEQYSTGKKIQRPSQDPIIAVRALKLRTNLSELNQYYEKNIPDARSWMNVSEEALKNMNEILTKVNSSCVQGADDHLTPSDRDSIAETLNEMKKQIYQEGNSNYAGRYVFTGYKTNSTMSFEENVTKNYEITEEFTGKDIGALSKVNTKDAALPSALPGEIVPSVTNTHRLRLSYGDVDGMVGQIKFTDDTKPVPVDLPGSPAAVNVISVNDAAAYKPAPGTINLIKETGELIISDETPAGPSAVNLYDSMKNAAHITVTYSKSNFVEGDLQPEHYFNCVDKTDAAKPITYTQADQQIQYEINFNQKLTVNTQGKDAFDQGIGRDIDEIISAVKDVQLTEKNIADVKKQLEDKSLSQTQIDALNVRLTNLQTEQKLKTDVMQDKFSKGILGSKNAQDKLNTAVADLGTRSVRLNLTEDRLSSQQVDFEELMSNNEDADIAETYIRLNSVQTLYTASLNAAGKAVKTSLLDFL